MQKIQKWSRCLRIMFQLILIIIPIAAFLDWVVFDRAGIEMLKAFKIDHENIIIPETIPYATRWLCFIIDMIPNGILMYAVYHLVKLFKLYEVGRIFTIDNIRHIKICAYATLAWIVANFIRYTLLILALTINNSRGFRYLAVKFSDVDFYPVIISVVVIVIAHIMDEARKIKDENEFTV